MNLPRHADRLQLETPAPTLNGNRLPGISDADLLRRAVSSARSKRTRGWHPRWTAIMDAFGLGSSYAHALCHAFGLDPDEKVRR